jgi:PAS domain-containing protein
VNRETTEESPVEVLAPAGGNPVAEIEGQTELFGKLPQLRQLIDHMPDVVLFLNENSQVVFANRAAAALLGLDDPAKMYGMHPGEILDCSHAVESDAGCGMTPFCGTCGAFKAIDSGLRGQEDTQECRLTRSKDRTAVEFRVRSSSITLEGWRFVFFVLTDISDEKRRRVLERIFFHDIMNTAGNIHGFAEILRDAGPYYADEFRETIHELSGRLIHEIESQREFLAAENGDLIVHPVSTESIPLLREVVDSNRRHEVAQGREIIIDPAAQQIEFTSDTTLLGRVLNNMTKNALEASDPGGTVTLSCDRDGDTVRFRVHRGLGTYGMKLLTERYLNGTVSFTTSQEEGTTFTASYPLDSDQ